VLDGGSRLSVEHPSGALQVEVELDTLVNPPRVIRSGVVRTARKLFDGFVFPRLSGPRARVPARSPVRPSKSV
jgi:2-methylaconitate cis-trans-isomerase PrpF